jgi:hypothetical protein
VTATLRVYNEEGLVVHEETIAVGSEVGARRVTKKCAQIAQTTLGSRVLVSTLRGDEERKIVKGADRRYYTRCASSNEPSGSKP